MASTITRDAAKEACFKRLLQQADCVERFTKRLAENGFSSGEAVIILLNANDVYGGVLANGLMPKHDWQAIRDRGEVPFVRGLAKRDCIQQALDQFDEEGAAKLREMSGAAVVVVDYGIAETFSAERAGLLSLLPRLSQN